MEDKGGLLRDLTGPDWAKFPEKGKVQEVGGFQSAHEEGSSRRQTRSGPSRYSPTPEPIHYPVIPPSDPEPSVPLDASDSYVPVENSEGWRYDWYPGTNSHPIPCYDSADDEVQSSPSVGIAPAVPVAPIPVVDGGNTVVIDISSDEEDPVEVQFAEETPAEHYQSAPTTGYGETGPSQYTCAEAYGANMASYLGFDGLFVTDTSDIDTSDQEYVPSGRPFIPESVRRTTRQHGWTPGMYAEW